MRFVKRGIRCFKRKSRRRGIAGWRMPLLNIEHGLGLTPEPEDEESF
ncbi:MAG: hypothetical protein KHY46_13405 [Clostridiales bacterium]|nr:hypothetical protein [Clostridiales bacterium]